MYSLYDMASACSSVPLSSWESDREKPRKRQPMHEDVLFRTRKEFDRHFSFAARYYCTWLLTPDSPERWSHSRSRHTGCLGFDAQSVLPSRLLSTLDGSKGHS